MKIRHATTADAVMLSELGAKTFYDAFAKDNSPENMEAYLRASFSPEIQLRELSQPESIFLIAESDGRPVGYAQLLLNSNNQAVGGKMPMELRRIYAVQEQIGKGVGRNLMSTAIDEARRRGCDILWLGVWEKNQRAIDFYRSWGFEVCGTHVFPLGEEPQTDLIMSLELTGRPY